MARGTSKADIGPMAVEVVKAQIKYEVEHITEVVKELEAKYPGFNYEEFRTAPADVRVNKKPGNSTEVGLKSVFLNVLNLARKEDRKALKEMVLHDVVRAVGIEAKVTYDGISKASDDLRPTLNFTLTVEREDDAIKACDQAVRAIRAFQVKENRNPRDFFGEVIVRNKAGKQLVIRDS